MSIKDLIGHIANKDYAAANQVFKTEMAARVSDALEDEKAAVAAEIYNGVQREQTESDEDDADDDDDEIEEANWNVKIGNKDYQVKAKSTVHAGKKADALAKKDRNSGVPGKITKIK